MNSLNDFQNVLLMTNNTDSGFKKEFLFSSLIYLYKAKKSHSLPCCYTNYEALLDI